MPDQSYWFLLGGGLACLAGLFIFCGLAVWCIVKAAGTADKRSLRYPPYQSPESFYYDDWLDS